jgi:hypothetical protein
MVLAGPGEAVTQLVVGARYLASTPYKSVYALISSSRTGPAIGEQFFPGSGKRTKIFYKVTVQP